MRAERREERLRSQQQQQVPQPLLGSTEVPPRQQLPVPPTVQKPPLPSTVQRLPVPTAVQ